MNTNRKNMKSAFETKFGFQTIYLGVGTDFPPLKHPRTQPQPEELISKRAS